MLQMTNLAMRFLATAVSIGGFMVPTATVAWSEDNRKTLSVCDVLADLATLNGKEITVRGEWVATDHGRWLRAVEACPMKLITKGFVWPNAIHLVEDKTDKLDFRLLAEMESQLERARGGQEERMTVVSFTGILQARVPPVVVHYPNGKVAGYGFGHLDALPAELRYRVAQDISIQKRTPSSERTRPR